MAEELGRITKPEAEQFKKGRRLFLVPLLFVPPSTPPDLAGIVDRYWSQAGNQVSNLEKRIGRVNKVYHEMVADSGEHGLKAVESLHMSSFPLAGNAVKRGADFIGIEDGEVMGEYMDWGRCLSIGLFNHKVLNTVLSNYQQAQDRRNSIMAERIDTSLQANEIAILIISENHRVQFPADIEVFYISPPALDEFKRWLRDQEAQQARPETPRGKKSGAEKEGEEARGAKPRAKAKRKSSASAKGTRKKTAG